MSKNLRLYPINEELKKVIEKQRKAFNKTNNIKISQSSFIKIYISPKIIPIINNQKIKLFNEKNVKKKYIKKR